MREICDRYRIRILVQNAVDDANRLKPHLKRRGRQYTSPPAIVLFLEEVCEGRAVPEC
jgi:hypothetical protein